MKGSDTITKLIKEINNSQEEWRTIYRAVHIAGGMINRAGQPVDLWMPALKIHTLISDKKFHKITTDSDDRFSKDYLVRIFSLFEPLLDMSMREVGYIKRPSFWEILKSKICGKRTANVRSWIGFLRSIRINGRPIINKQDERLLRLTKESRNCYIHNANLINRRWIDAYKKIPNFYGTHFSLKQAMADETIVPGGMPHFKAMGDLIVRITNDIETYLKNLP